MGKVDQNDIQIKELNEHMEHRNLTEKMIAFQICDLVFKIKNQLKKHNKKEHEAGEGENLCNYCDTKFNENCELELHLKTHLEAETFKCKLCEKTFVSKWRLRKYVSGNQGKVFCHYFNNQRTGLYISAGGFTTVQVSRKVFE